jgi:hypothetical protein
MTMKGDFMQRQNGDSTTDLICLYCFRTVARSGEQSDLAAAEREHMCSPFDELVMFRSGSLADLSRQVKGGRPWSRSGDMGKHEPTAPSPCGLFPAPRAQ